MLLKFSDLWSKHPANQSPRIIEPCKTDGKGNFANQCAIRMGVCLADCGADLSSFPGVWCWHGHGRKHILRAQELGDYLKTRSDIVGKVEIDKEPVVGTYSGRRGIALFVNFWGTNNQGDHIDVWNGTKMAKGAASYFASSEEVWFWELGG